MNDSNTVVGQKHVFKSSIWVFGGQFGGLALRLSTNLIMTRLLVPEMFGVMAVANTVIIGLSLCSYIGLQHNIIQSVRGDEQIFLDTAWTLQVARGVLLFIIALLISLGVYAADYYQLVPMNSVYADPTLPKIIAVLSLIPLISGFESTKLATASRHMRLDKLTMIELGCQTIALLAMVAFALIYQSIWALVFGTMLGAIAKVIAGYVVLPGPRNHFKWEKQAVSDLIHFGKWILLTTIMGFFVKNSDKLILGALITPQLLGIYSIAIFMTAAIHDGLSRWGSAVVLPVLSRVYRESNESNKAIGEAYYKFSFPFNLATLFLCGFLFNAGYVIIEMLYDSRYSATGHMIQILSVSLIGARTILAEQCYVAMGRPKLSVPMNVLQLVVLFGALVPAYRYYGMDGALYVIGFTLLLTLPLTWYFLKRFGVLDWKRELITFPAIFVGYGASKVFVAGYEYIKALL